MQHKDYRLKAFLFFLLKWLITRALTYLSLNVLIYKMVIILYAPWRYLKIKYNNLNKTLSIIPNIQWCLTGVVVFNYCCYCHTLLDFLLMPPSQIFLTVKDYFSNTSQFLSLVSAYGYLPMHRGLPTHNTVFLDFQNILILANASVILQDKTCHHFLNKQESHLHFTY